MGCEMVEITVNGERRRLDEMPSITALMRALGYPPEHAGVAVAVNGEVVTRNRWQETRLEHGDRVEIVGAVQGG